jgi:hypothetical protein
MKLLEFQLSLTRRRTRNSWHGTPQPDAIDLLASVDPIRIWRETIFDNWKDTGFEVDWARFSESAAKER